MRSHHVTRSILLALFVLAAAYALLYLLHDGVGLMRWKRSGFLESRLAHARDSTAVFRKAIRDDFVAAPFPLAGDTVLEVDGRPMTLEYQRRFGPTVAYDIQPFAARQALSVKYLHAGDTLYTAFAMNPPSKALTWLLVFVDLLRHLIVLSMLAVGGWGIISRGDSIVVQVFGLYCLSRAGESMGSYFIPLSYGLLPHDLIYRLSSGLPYLLSVGMVSFWLHLQFVFPRPLRWVRRNRGLAYTLCYFPAALLLLGFLARQFPEVNRLFPPALVSGKYVDIVSWMFLLAGVVILAIRYHTSEDRLEQRQLRLFIGGSAVGLVASALLSGLYAFRFAWYDSSPYIDLIGSAIVYVATLLGPVSFVWAFRRYRLMDIEGKLRRGTRYALVTGILLAVLVGAVIGSSRFLLALTDVQSVTVTLALGFGLALGILPARKRINTLIENKLYPDRAKLRARLHDFLNKGAAPVDQHGFWSALAQLLREGMKVQTVHTLRMDQPGIRLNEDGAVARYLFETRRALLVDEAATIGKITAEPDQLAWFRKRHIGMLVPLVFRDRLIDVIAIGLRADGEDYDSEELLILNAFAPQIAIAAENLRLIEENVDKKRMEMELASARSTQIGLLPQGIPACPGLEIAAVCHFCLEVAGDYYDIVPLPDGQTCIAIGDVSGKGASASLLMASLQASLNTAIPFGIALPDIVSRINNVVCRNTSPEQFITFFVGVFDPETLLFRYVNAGHDQPIVTRADGTQESLVQGGLILGFIPGCPYAEGRIQLQPGDSLLLYTDGVREACNFGNEEFGLERLARFAVDGRLLPCKEQIRALQKQVVSFCECEHFEDDFTVLMVKVT